jgi:two-component system sensor histidine kinase KdpD
MRWGESLLGLDSEQRPVWLGLLVAVTVVAIATAIVYPLKSLAPAVSLGIVFVPAVLLVSAGWGLWQGLFTALLSAMAFNWFHLPPVGRVTIADDRSVVALVVFVIVAVASSALAEVARARATEAEHRREEADRTLAEMAELSREKDRMQAEAIEAAALRRSDELKTALLRSVSHDLRTPLTSMIAAGAALDSSTVTPSERHELSVAIVEEGERLSRLVENLLDVSRLESGNAKPHREQVSLAEVLEAARHSIGAAGQLVQLALDPDLPPLSADPVQLERAFANLLDNGARYGEGKAVQVSARVIGSSVEVRVVDQGPGIPVDERERIFLPFYQAKPGAPRKGSGLGLAIAKGFIEANGGKIGVESLPGQGTSFVVTLPLAEGGRR